MSDKGNGKPSFSLRDVWLGALAVFSGLLVVYLITFNGRFTSIDELALYAMTESLVQEGNLETPQLSFATYHNPVGDLEPGLPLAASPLYWLSQQSKHLNSIQAAMLLNPLVTALTAAVIYAVGRLLGYSSAASAFAALAFGLATLAWPYAKSFYREPLVGLSWSLGLLFLLLWRQRRARRWAIIGGAILILTLAIKVTALAAIPFIFMALLGGSYSWYRDRRFLLMTGGIAAMLLILFFAVYTWRFETTTYLTGITNVPIGLVLKRLYGQLLSPGKGLLFYMPVVLLSVPGLILMWQRHRTVTLAVLMPMVTTAIAYSFYGSWFGGQSWGPRFLVPAIPLLMVSLAPLWDESRSRLLKGLYIGLLALSMLVQLAAVSADWWLGYQPLFDSGPNPEETTGLRIDSVALSPPVAQIRSWRIENLDLLWLHTDHDGALSFSAGLIGLLLLCAVGVGVLWWLVRRRGIKIGWLLLPIPILLAILLIFGSPATAGYPGLPADQAQDIAAWAVNVDSQPLTVVTMSNDFSTNFLLGYLKGDFNHFWYSPDQTEGFHSILDGVRGQWLSLILDRVHKDPAFSGKDLEWWLNEQFFRSESAWIGDYELVRYAILPAFEPAWKEVDVQYGESFLLKRYALSEEQFSAGETVGLLLEICRIGDLPGYHHLFTHLISGTGQANGFDGPLRYGGTVVIPWEEGDCLVERRSITIPRDISPAAFDLIAGFDTPDGLLPALESQGQPADYAILQQVIIE